MKTDQKLIAAAAALLDSGGEPAVTLRAVAQAVGVSHNAPYKHFTDRNALLAAVAIADFDRLTAAFEKVRRMRAKSLAKLRKALVVFAEYGQRYPARYRLLFSDPKIAAQGGALEAAALSTFVKFASIVEECQSAGALPATPTAELTGLIFAAVHGLIDLQAGGRLRKEKGLTSVGGGMDLLLSIMTRVQNPDAGSPDPSTGAS